MMVHFLKALFESRHRFVGKAHTTDENETTTKSFCVDRQKRDYLINHAYKETAKWKQGRRKRLTAYALFFTPLVLYAAIFVVMILTDIPWLVALVDASPVPLILMIVLWSIALIILKSQYHNAKTIPEDRRNDKLTLSENGLVYTYFCTTDGHTYTSEIRYKDISKMEVSKSRKTLYIVGACQTHAVKGRRSEVAIFSPYITVPLYFREMGQSLCDMLKATSGKEIANIE